MTASTAQSREVADDLESLKSRFVSTRRFTELIVEPLSPEDCMVQSMDDVSPTRWHLAHTTWFFETFALRDEPGYRVFDDSYGYLFNSYYNTIGELFPRDRRGMISRPGLDEIKRYRAYVDEQIAQRLDSDEYTERVASILHIGLQHEQQHQELMLTDVKHVLSCNPTYPSYRHNGFHRTTGPEQAPICIPAGNYEIGDQGNGFAFDNESPQHTVHLSSCVVAPRLVTCGEYLEFIQDGGYERPDHWLSLGWQTVQQEAWRAPLYWTQKGGEWMQFTLAGLVPINSAWPVCHVSLFEADAYSRWTGKRLPTEFELEVAAARCAQSDLATEPFADYLLGNDLSVHPTCSPASLLGSVWEWTSSSYAPYPGYRPPSGAIGEYNGKFMCNQYVLRGGSVATHSTHIRPTYRNFFPASARWQFSGIRLAEDA